MENLTCPICIDILNGRNMKKTVTTKCKHVFHKSCITTWFSYNNICPLCKKSQSKEDIFKLTGRDIKVNKNHHDGIEEGNVIRVRITAAMILREDHLPMLPNWPSFPLPEEDERGTSKLETR